jgi:putative hydrolase of the HAD superfamily
MGSTAVDTRRESRPLGGIPSPFAGAERIRAVLFDLDGTLYVQSRMRAAMAAELLMHTVRHPLASRRRLRALSAYRDTQEAIRVQRQGRVGPDDQIAIAAERAGVSSREMASLVEEWMLSRPLKYVAFCRARGLEGLLDFLSTFNVKMGVLSDYPPAGKLKALGVERHFSSVLCSTDPDIGALKPDPRGFLTACRRWNLSAREVLMVGDRVDVDAAGAAAAGMPCVLIGKPPRSTTYAADLLVLDSLERLRRVLDAHR